MQTLKGNVKIHNKMDDFIGKIIYYVNYKSAGTEW
jgi:hypothetical protein